jgi:ankyrin repeat protein
LHTAAYQGLHDEVARLLGEGVDINSLGRSWGTALHAASSAGKGIIVELLVNRGADPQMCLRPLGTALQAACRGSSLDVVTILLAAGADPNISSGNITGNMFETSALHVASSRGDESIVKMLLEAGANVNAEATDFNGIRPLHLAASKGHSKVAKILLDHGAEVDALVGKESPETPLIYAAAEGWEEVVVVLINGMLQPSPQFHTGVRLVGKCLMFRKWNLAHSKAISRDPGNITDNLRGVYYRLIRLLYVILTLFYSRR